MNATMAANVSFRSVDKTDEIMRLIEDRITRLRRIDSSILSWRVHLERSHGHHQSGNEHTVRVNVTIPGADLVGQTSVQIGAPHQILAALSSAFRAVERQLLGRGAKRHLSRRTTRRDRPSREAYQFRAQPSFWASGAEA